MKPNANKQNGKSKVKTYVIMMSKQFTKGHPKEGAPTEFADKILLGQNLSKDKCVLCRALRGDLWPKIHTIRENYDYWAPRIKEVQEGRAVLSIREWTGKPYNSSPITICTLTAENGVGIQKVVFDESGRHTIREMVDNRAPHYRIDDESVGSLDVAYIAHNDGLSFFDFANWFAKHDVRKPLAIIHFTKFRY
ncbi:hypothetical protein [Alistipes sp.]|uniref:hypothetical protein n=1 Tax=Alistipes sp. TaxID=1872444 RepID=UPI003528DAB6